MNFGYSTGVFFPKATDIPQILRDVFEITPELAEINLATLSDLEYITEETVMLARKFTHVTIHAPMINMRYTSESGAVLDTLREFAESVNASYVLFHPDIVDDFTLVYEKLGSFTAFENMDVRKKFGSTVADLQQVFSHCPKAQWVCDLNHVYTVDKTMLLARDLHNAFRDRLVGYHISGYKDDQTLHTCLFLTNETEILSALEDTTKLVVHEGGATQVNDFLLQETQYINKYFSHHD